MTTGAGIRVTVTVGPNFNLLAWEHILQGAQGGTGRVIHQGGMVPWPNLASTPPNLSNGPW